MNISEINLFDLIAIFIITFCVVKLIRMYMIKRKKKPKPMKVTTEIHCKKCNKGQIRNFKEGDYVFKACGKCKCGSTKRIVKIYTKDKTEKERKWERYEKKFEV